VEAKASVAESKDEVIQVAMSQERVQYKDLFEYSEPADFYGVGVVEPLNIQDVDAVSEHTVVPSASEPLER